MDEIDYSRPMRVSHGKEFYDEDAPSIPLEAWKELIAADPTLEPVSELTGINPRTKELIRIRLPEHSVLWQGGPDGLPVCIKYTNGGLEPDIPDEFVYKKMQEIAAILMATLHLGDDW